MTTAIETAGLTFLCDDPIEVWRAQSLLEKEPGTIAWLDRLQPGDVFYDVGANIGVYSLYAAKRGAKVYAFEPNAINALHLARNAKANGLDITVVNMVVGQSESRATFHYRSLRPGSNGPALASTGDAAKATVEMGATKLSHWIEYDAGEVFVKVDTDGDEVDVLHGMVDGLSDVSSLQFEVHPNERRELHDLLALYGFASVHVHYTQQGQQAIDRGADPATIVNNTIFERA
jgi:FkbM family methyltransferase